MVAPTESPNRNLSGAAHASRILTRTGLSCRPKFSRRISRPARMRAARSSRWERSRSVTNGYGFRGKSPHRRHAMADEGRSEGKRSLRIEQKCAMLIRYGRCGGRFPEIFRVNRRTQSTLRSIDEPHIAPLTAFVRQLRLETGYNEQIPFFDPLDGGVEAEILYLFRGFLSMPSSARVRVQEKQRSCNRS